MIQNKKPLNKKIIELVISCVMILTLILVILYACVWSVDTTLFVNDKIESLNVNMYGEENHCSVNIYEDNSKIKVLYFYDEVKEDEIKSLSTLSCDLKTEHNQEIDIYLISSYKHRNENKEAVEALNIDKTYFNYLYDDVESKALLKFKTQIEYPLYLWTDLNGVIKYSSTSGISKQFVYIHAVYSSINIGNQVGDLCYERDIETLKIENGTLVKDSTFNILNNKKIKIINFWGWWCTPCKSELIYLNDVVKKYSDQVEFIAIHQGTTYKSDDDVAEAYDYINKHPNLVYTWGHDDLNDSYYTMLGGKNSYPMTVIVDGDCIVRFTRQGALEEDKLDEILKELTNK